MANRLGIKILILLTPAIFIFFTACGGNEKEPPPPVNMVGPEYPHNAESLRVLSGQVQFALNACTQAAAPFVAAAAPIIAATPNVPFAALQAIPAMAPIFAGPPTPAQGQCSNAIGNAMMNFTTIDNGRYAQRPDAQRWWETAFIRPMGTRFGQYMPMSAIQNPAFVSGMINSGVNFFQTRITPYVPPQYGYAVNSAIGQISTSPQASRGY